MTRQRHNIRHTDAYTVVACYGGFMRGQMLSDLIKSDNYLYAQCRACKRTAELDVPALLAIRDRPWKELERHMKCSCGHRGAVMWRGYRGRK